MMARTAARADERNERIARQRALDRPTPHTVPGTDATPPARRTATALIMTLPTALVVGLAVVWRAMPAACPDPAPPPSLRARFDSLLAGACPVNTRLPPPVFTHTILGTLRPDRRSEPVWIADAHAERAWGVRIVLDADTGAVKAFSSEVWAAHPPNRSAPPEIRTASDARSAARRCLLWLGKPAVEDAGWHVTEPEVMLPHPWGTWLVSARRGDQRWQIALDAQTGNLLDFREEVATSRLNP